MQSSRTRPGISATTRPQRINSGGVDMGTAGINYLSGSSGVILSVRYATG